MLQSLDNGRYTVRRALGRGGMGVLFLATDHGAFERLVVVKILLDGPPGADEAELRAARARFADEARTLAALRHPFIPKIFAYFAEGPACFIVMEHVDGRDLEQGLSRADDADRPILGSPYPAADVARWGASLCGVLEYLHAQRPLPVLHQDIKPSNLVRDEQSGALFLVDFGTAQAHGGGHTGGYGTPGYAPPEQYRGQSEPRSDVYALAATLYHLATDDDPTLHPFSFPRLDALGELGEALRPALDKNPAARPDAAQLKRALELLAQPLAARTLLAPDRTTLYDERQLVEWCEGNWAAAAHWLRSYAAVDHLGQRWGKPGLARRLRAAVATTPADDNAALDAALALLDPQGYGAAKPALAIEPGDVLCTTRRGALKPVTLTVTNRGRRFVRARLVSPPWLDVSVPAYAKAPDYSERLPSLSLAPGQTAALTLSSSPMRASLRQHASETVELREEGAGGLATGAVLAEASLRARWPWQPPKGMGVLLAAIVPLIIVASCIVGVTQPHPEPQPSSMGNCPAKGSYEWEVCVGIDHSLTPTPHAPYPPPGAPGGDYSLPPTPLPAYPVSSAAYPAPAEAMYDLARAAFTQGRWDEALNYLDGLQNQYRGYRDSDSMLDEALYQQAHRAYGAKQWAEMLGPLLRLQARHLNYKDASFLLKEAYYHPGKIAFERADYDAAVRNFRVVYDLDPAYLDTANMLGYAYNMAAEAAIAANNIAAAEIYVERLGQLRPDFPTLPKLRAALEATHQPTPTTMH